MNKQQLCEILEACLLKEDGFLTEQEIIEKVGNLKFTKIGIKLNDFLHEKVK